jgi:hypothetical protein
VAGAILDGMRLRVFLLCWLCTHSPALSVAQENDEPFLGGRLLWAGEVSANLAPVDPGYFNHTDYSRDSMRLFRLNLSLELRATNAISVLTEIRSDNLDPPRPYALYLRLHPFRERAFDIQVGRIPPVFGTFSRRLYEYDNPLIGYPLPYQYPTSIRADSVPGRVEQLLFYRGYGARVAYPIGDREFSTGLAQVNPLRWDTGVEARIGNEPLQLAVALTQGTVSNPRFRDDNEGKQIAGRLGVRPVFGLKLGFSAARGDYVSDEVKALLPGGASLDSHETAFGVDSEVATGPWLLRAEAIWTRWDMPSLETHLDALGWTAEGRYKITAGFWLAARYSGSRFESLEAPTGAATWDAPVSRIEAGVGYSFYRRLMAKLVIQHNERDGGRRESATLPAVQVLFWF